MTECKLIFILKNVKKDIMASLAAQNVGTVRMEKRVINTTGVVMVVAYHTF